MVNETTVRRDLSRLFNLVVIDDPALMQECVQICCDYNISGEDLFFKWEAFSFNNVPVTPTAGTSRTIQALTLAGAKGLRGHIARDVAKSNEKRTTTTRTTNTRFRGGGQSALAARHGRGGTHSHNTSTSVGASRNARLPFAASASVKFVGLTSDEVARRAYRYLFEKISVRSEVLDDRIDEFSEIVREKYGIEELGDPDSVTDDDVTVVGRICVDSETDASSSSSQLSTNTLVLEASRMGGSGQRVPLKFDPDFVIRGTQDASGGKSLFPGEIVVLRGRNGGGGLFSVKEIFSLPAVTRSSEPSSRDLSVLVTSGPYTSEQDLDFEGFLSIIEEAKNARPSVLLLLGPFIDTSHPLVKSGKLHSSPLSIFQQAFLHPIQSLLQKSTDTLVLLVPSVQDFLSSHNVFPQGVRDGDYGQLPSSIKVLPNPCLFSLNDIRFGVSTVDVLFHIKKRQHVQRPQQPSSRPANASSGSAHPDAITGLCRHLLEQRSFYPLFPVPFELSADVNLDISHAEHLSLGTSAPEVLVLSSVLRHFSKNVDGVVMLNTGGFSKSRIAAQIYVPAGAGANNNMCDNVKVELRRLG